MPAEDDDGVPEPGISIWFCGNGLVPPASQLVHVPPALHEEGVAVPYVARAPEWAATGTYATSLVTLHDEGEGVVAVRIRRRHDPRCVLLARAADRATATVLAHAATCDVHLRTRSAMGRWAAKTLCERERHARWRAAVQATDEALTLRRAF